MIGTINKILKRFLGDKRETDIKEIQPTVNAINQIGESLRSISIDELRDKSNALKSKIRQAIEPFELEISTLKNQAENLPSSQLEEKEALFAQVDAITKKIDAEIEKVLEEILPEAFAILKETARRLKDNPELKLRASDHDRRLAALGRDYVSIDGDTTTWKNNWNAAGNRITWDMVHYDVQLIGGIALHRGKVAEMGTGEGKTLVATLDVFLNTRVVKG